MPQWFLFQSWWLFSRLCRLFRDLTWLETKRGMKQKQSESEKERLCAFFHSHCEWVRHMHIPALQSTQDILRWYNQQYYTSKTKRIKAYLSLTLSRSKEGAMWIVREEQCWKQRTVHSWHYKDIVLSYNIYQNTCESRLPEQSAV